LQLKMDVLLADTGVLGIAVQGRHVDNQRHSAPADAWDAGPLLQAARIAQALC
jgi:hypothetical protein